MSWRKVDSDLCFCCPPSNKTTHCLANSELTKINKNFSTIFLRILKHSLNSGRNCAAMGSRSMDSKMPTPKKETSPKPAPRTLAWTSTFSKYHASATTTSHTHVCIDSPSKWRVVCLCRKLSLIDRLKGPLMCIHKIRMHCKSQMVGQKKGGKNAKEKKTLIVGVHLTASQKLRHLHAVRRRAKGMGRSGKEGSHDSLWHC